MAMSESLRLKDQPASERPRERLVARGPDALTHAELIAILLRTGLQGINVVQVGQNLLQRFGSLHALALAWLVAALRRGGGELLDCQFTTPHLASLGSREIPQADYLTLLAHATRPWQPGENSFYCGGDASTGASSSAVSGAGALLTLGFAALAQDAAATGSSSSPGNFIAQSLIQTS